MRILAIRGENLASLARPFELDLMAEPLAGAGLFAITRETGSGKSTILDALCLALYGKYPRIAVARQENVPDPSGKELSISFNTDVIPSATALPSSNRFSDLSTPCPIKSTSAKPAAAPRRSIDRSLWKWAKQSVQEFPGS